MEEETKKILVTGADGMLGTDIVEYFSQLPGITVIPSTIEDMDITIKDRVERFLGEHQPDVVIHTAAYTAVDRAEDERSICFDINSRGTKNIAAVCGDMQTAMIYTSTDYVFDGSKPGAYVETDKPCPINVYGESKLEGETHVQSLVLNHKVVRVSWLNGVNLKYSSNFIDAVLRRVRLGARLRIIDDQRGSPTFTHDLARHLALLVERPETGIFHVTNQGVCSWFQFARDIMRVFGYPDYEITPIATLEYPTRARRPYNSALENSRLVELGIPLMPSWQDGLKEYHERFLRMERTKLT